MSCVSSNPLLRAKIPLLSPNFPVCLEAMKIQHRGKSEAHPETNHSSMLRAGYWLSPCWSTSAKTSILCYWGIQALCLWSMGVLLSCWDNYWPIVEWGQQNVLARRAGRSQITTVWAIWKMTVKNAQIKSDYALQSWAQWSCWQITAEAGKCLLCTSSLRRNQIKQTYPCMRFTLETGDPTPVSHWRLCGHAALGEQKWTLRETTWTTLHHDKWLSPGGKVSHSNTFWNKSCWQVTTYLSAN